MYEMQTIVTDVQNCCMSVCLSVTQLTSASLCKMAEQIKMLFGVNMEHCVVFNDTYGDYQQTIAQDTAEQKHTS